MYKFGRIQTSQTGGDTSPIEMYKFGRIQTSQTEGDGRHTIDRMARWQKKNDDWPKKILIKFLYVL